MKNIHDILQKNTLTQLPILQHIFTVSDLYSYDMIYIYHQIQEGTKVILVRDDLQIGGNYRYSVYFKDFQIGTLFVSSFFSAQYGNLDKIEAEIASITKEKYLPIKNLDVIIKQRGLKLVS
jgi:hypothetical protein